jgi:trigger factor
VTLTIQTTEDERRQLTVTIEVDESRVQKAMQAKARELSREIQLPGFRPGKAPYDVVVRRIGEDTLRGEAIEDLVQPVFEEALNQAELDPYAQPSLDDIQTKPLVLTFTVPLSPTVTLGAYRDHRQEVEAVAVTDEALQEALEHVQTHHQVIEAVDRPAAEGDVVTLSGRGWLVGRKPTEGEAETGAGEEAATEPADEVLFDEERLDVLLDPQTLFVDTPFVANVVGLSVGDEKQFSFTFPDLYEPEPEHAGREATFELTILEVKKRELPPLDDELAKLDGRYETLDELREALRADLTQEAENTQKERVIEEMVDRMLEDAQLVYPPAAVESHLDDMVEDFKTRLSRSGWQFQDYLNLQGMTEQALRDDFRENAERQLRRQLVLRQFILDERLRVSAADLDAIIDQRLARFDNDALKDSLRQYYRSGQGFEAISGEVLSNKVYDRIRAVMSGEAPDLAELAALAEAEDEEE